MCTPRNPSPLVCRTRYGVDENMNLIHEYMLHWKFNVTKQELLQGLMFICGVSLFIC
jgi:hypothetical protein